MSISFSSFRRSIQRSLLASLKAERDERQRAEEKARSIKETEAAWAAELRRREAALLDADGIQAAKRQAKQEQQENERLQFEAEMIVRRQAILARWDLGE